MAVLIVAATTGIRATLVPLIGIDSPLLALLPAIFAVAYVSGLGPALLACALSALSATVLFTREAHGTAVLAWSAHIVLFGSLGVLISLITHQMQTELARRKRIEAELREALGLLREREQRLELATNVAELGIFVWDLRTNQILSESARNHDIFGRKVEDAPVAYEEFFGQFVEPDDREQFAAGVRDALTSSRPMRLICRIRRQSDQALRWIEIAGQVQLNWEGSPQHVIGILRDISEHRQAEEALKESARQLRLVTDNLPVLISYVDRDGSYRFTNAQWIEWRGAEQVPKLGQHVREVLGEDAYHARQQYIEAALSGKTVRFESGMQHRSLGARDCEISYIPDLGEDGRARGFYVMAQDITERKRAETALREREAMLQLIYDHSSDCLYLIEIGSGAELRFVSVNETFLRVCGYAREQVEGLPVASVKLGVDWEATHAKYREAIASRQPLVYYEEAEFPAGRRCGEITLIPIIGDSGAVTHILGNMKDVTARKQAEDALREADRRKDEFLAMLAHELRNPLAPIRTIAHILARGDATDAATVRRHGELLRRQGTQLARLLDDLLDVARITRGTIELRKETLALAAIIDRAMEEVQPLLTLKRQNVSVSSATPPLFVEGDEVRLTQVFGNLLKNASKYSGERMIIEVMIERDGDYACVRVRDSAAGIDPQLLPHIFDLFTQADRSLDRTEGGLGVGLTVAKHLLDLHSGTISAHSEGLQRGSEFTVRLPAKPAPATLELGHAPQAARQPGRRVLIVEDNRDSAEALALLLSADGHVVEVAHDGATALSKLQTSPADVAIVDIGLPGMDGYVLAQCIRERFGDKAPLLYALTGYGREEDRALAAGAGFDRHMTKPVDPQVLLALLTREESAPDQQTLKF